MLAEVQAGILSERRKRGPYGLAGGSSGAAGKNELILKDCMQPLPSKSTFRIPAGGLIRIETPGGGGWGKTKRKTNSLRTKTKSPKA
jgi:N-methylhydantoinase B